MRQLLKKTLLVLSFSLLLSYTCMVVEASDDMMIENTVSQKMIENLQLLDEELFGKEKLSVYEGGIATGSDKVLGKGVMPSVGNVKSLVVMVEFADVKFSDSMTPEYIEDIMFGSQNESAERYPQESVNAWYQRASFGKLSIHGEVKEIMVSQTKEYYTDDETSGETKETLFEEEIGTIVKELNIDWSEYDSNNDKYIDSLCFIVAGESGEWASQWWSKVEFGSVEVDDVYKVGHYAMCMGDRMVKAGTAIHEFGHCLGLPDLYNTERVGSVQGGCEANDMMSNNTGDFNALFKMMLGWIDADQIQVIEYGSDLQNVTLESYNQTGDCAIIFLDDGSETIFSEYYLIEYQDLTENTFGWRWKIEKPFLQIYHVNAELTEENGYFRYASSAPGDFCKLIEGVHKDAESIHCDHSITFGGTSVYGPLEGEYTCGYETGDEFTPYTAPSSAKYAEDRLVKSVDVFSGLNISNIKVDENQASFQVFFETEPLAVEKLKFSSVENLKNCETSDLQFQLVANHDIWLNEGAPTAFVREVENKEQTVVVFLDMEKIWPYHFDTMCGHYSFKVMVDSSAQLEKNTEYELVFPAGMFVTSYGDVSGEIVFGGIATYESIPIESISVIPKEIELTVGENTKLSVTISPDDTTDDMSTVWSTSDAGIATVDSTGKVTAVSEGEVVITATVGRLTAECRISVTTYAKKQVTAFVERMYTIALGRSSDPSGIEYWSNQLLTHQIDGAKLSEGFILSDEFEEKNYSDADYLKVLYKTFFNREADEGGIAHWTSQLNAGKSRRSVLAGFVNSAEFDELCTAYGIDRGTMTEEAPVEGGVEQFVERMYTIALERASEPTGLAEWTRRINAGESTPEEVAKFFFLSDEYVEKNTSNDKYIETLYLTFMGRASEASGKAYWVDQLKQGVSRATALEGFAQSPEFQEIMKRYGL